MSIQSAILALNPTAYWKLDDPTGPAAVDSSGNAHAGVYGGAFSLRQPGPEAGTFSAMFSNTGAAQANPGAWMVSATCTLMAWIAMIAPPSSLSTFLFASNFATLGASVTESPSGTTFGQLGVTRSNISNANANVWITDNLWHHIAVSFNGASSFLALDGINVMAPGGENAPSGTSKVGIGTPTGVMLAAHFASWNAVALSLAQIQSVATGFTGPLVVPPGAGGSNATYPDILAALTAIQANDTSMSATLAAILASVRKTYPTT